MLATIFLSRFFRSHRFGFGGEKMLDHVLLDISVADEPPGWAHCLPREVRIETPKRCIRDMVHNEICNDERVAAWLRG